MSDVASTLSFLGPIGGPELILIFIVLLLVVAPMVIVLIVMAIKGSGSRVISRPPPMPAVMDTQARLQELDALKVQGLISTEEYENNRRKILNKI